MKTQIKLLFTVLTLLGMLCVQAQTPTFTYQGRLNDTNGPVTGTANLTFRIFTAASGGAQLWQETTNGVPVANSLFAAELGNVSPIIGPVLDGSDRWLEIVVNGTTLTNRQRITHAPYAIRAREAATAASAATATTVATDGVSATSLQDNSVSSAKIADGAITATDVNSASFSNTFWKMDGNAGTTPGAHFVGTTDNQPLEIRANSMRMFRLEPAGLQANILTGPGVFGLPAGVVGVVAAGADVVLFNGTESSYTVIAGGQGNTIRSNAYLAVISGGEANLIQTNSYAAFIGGGQQNTVGANSPYSVIAGGDGNTAGVNANFATIGGGSGNTNRAGGGTIAGGRVNQVGSGASYSFVGGGSGNLVSSNSSYAAIAGGQENTIGLAAYQSTVGGGWLNSVGDGSDSSTIGGGRENRVQQDYATIAGGVGNTNNAPFGSIGGGFNNSIMAANSLIAGGRQNLIWPNANSAAIGGGETNTIFTNAYYAIIAGGHGNQIGQDTYAASVGGGEQNVVANGVQWATIPGGYSNRVGASYSFAAGRQAMALHSGAFVWADSQNTDFVSTTLNQFLVRASGGVGINTNSPQSALHVHGTVTAGGFSGTGAGLTALNASQLTTGAVSPARGGTGIDTSSAIAGSLLRTTAPGLWGALPPGSAGQVLKLQGGFPIWGTDDTGSGTVTTVSTGPGLTGGPVTTSGTLSIDTNVVPRLAAANSFTGTNTFLSKVGIGTSGPATSLTVMTPGAGYGVEHTDGSRRLSTYLDANGGWLGTVSADPLNFFVANGGASLTIDTSARVGIGRSPTANILEVEGNASKTTAGSWLANSDARIKHDIQPVAGALAALEKVRLVSFRYTDGYREQHSGVEDRRYLNVVAQEFREVFPEHVKSSGETLPDGSEILQVDTYPLTIYSAAAIQELNQKLEQKLQQKETEISELKQTVNELKELVQAMNHKRTGGAK